MKELFADIVEHCGKISGLVHAAGIGGNYPLKAMQPALYQDYFNINVVAGMEMVRNMVLRKNLDLDHQPAVLLISSVSSFSGEAALVGYSITKGGINAATRALAKELSLYGVRVNAIAPAQIVDTIMGAAFVTDLPEENRKALAGRHKLGFGKVDDLPGSAIFLLSPAARWITGVVLPVEGGYLL